MTIMRWVKPAPWPRAIECRVCGHPRQAELTPSGRLRYGTLSRCWKGCTLEMLRAKLAAERRGRDEMQIKKSARAGGAR